jgi:probable HAF family extracellular repeat protein
MQTIGRNSILSLSMVLCLCAVPSAQIAGQIKAMKLLTPDVGWAATNKKLFWATDGGKQWNDITPRPAIPGEIIAAVFFLNSSTGWVLFAGSNDTGENRFDLAATADSGAHWTLSRVKISGLTPAEAILTGDGYMYFLDPIHGWINLTVASGSAFHMGAALVTQDGGKNWNWVPMGSGSSGPIMFTTVKDGWILSPDHTELYVTHDGSKSWQQVSLQAPQFAHGATESYFPPTFQDANHGFLIAGFPDLDQPVLFVTTDGGFKWNASRTLPHTEGEIAIIDSRFVAVSIPDLGSLTLTTVSLVGVANQGTAVNAKLNRIAGLHGVDSLNFIDGTHGWILAGELLATANGGVTWTDITPPGARPDLHTDEPWPGSVQPGGALSAPRARSASRTEIGLSRPSVPVGVQTALGFDISQVLCKPFPNCSTQQSINYMQSWANFSPYLVTSIYLPSQNHATDHYLNASWVTAIWQQGWGLIPIWVGLQSPCSCKPGTGTYPNCTLFTYQLGPDAATAASQGTADATTAEGVAAGLISSGVAIVYKDLENYNPASVLPSGARCGDVVNAYLSSWNAKLHHDFFAAGVYGNPIPAVDWQARVSPLPDDAWIAQYPAAGKPPAVTIWNLGTAYGMTDSMWPFYQRIHQYTNTHNEAWGGTPSFGVDGDIANAEIVSNNNVTNYTYNTPPTNIDCPGAINTVPLAINDMNNGVLINGPGQRGAVVGYFQASLGSPIYGFQNTAGTCTTITVSGAVYVEATGINNLGQIVGYFEDSNGAFHGYLQNPGKSPTQIDYSGGGQTYLYGINDAGQVVGFAYSPSTFYYQTFMYYGGHFYPLGFSGNFDYTLGYGINGDATLTGTYYFQPYTDDFELSAIPPTWTGTVIDLTPGGMANTIAHGINANNELAGIYYSTACMNTSDQCAFMWPGSVLLNILTYGGTANVVYGMNDFGQLVGPYTDTSTQYSHGALWTHQ